MKEVCGTLFLVFPLTLKSNSSKQNKKYNTPTFILLLYFFIDFELICTMFHKSQFCSSKTKEETLNLLE